MHQNLCSVCGTTTALEAGVLDLQQFRTEFRISTSQVEVGIEPAYDAHMAPSLPINLLVISDCYKFGTREWN